MKTLVNWILFVPVCLLSVALVLLSGLMPEYLTGLLSTDINGIAEIITIAVLGLFLVCFVVSLFNRKTSSVYLLSKNYFAGVFALLSAFTLASSAALDITSMVQTGELGVLSVITVLFTALCGVAMLFVGLNHFSGVNTPRPVSILYLSLPLWCGVHLIDRFMKHTATPVAAAETLDLIMFVALAMFFIYAMMIHAVIPTKNTVKYAVTFGFPTTVICLVYSVTQIFAVMNSETPDVLFYIPAISYGALGLYTLCFTAELSMKAKTTDELTVAAVSDDEYTDENGDEFTDEYDDEINDDFIEKEVVTPAYVEQNEPAPVSDIISGAEDTSDAEDIDASYIPVAPAKIRTAQSEDDAESVFDDSDSADTDEDDIAQELYEAAQKRDTRADVAEPVSNGSDEEVIIDGEFEKKASFVRTSDNAQKPKGPVEREAVMFDDDFILSIDSKDTADAAPVFDKDEDISAFILEKTVDVSDDEVAAKNKYDARLDEIDKLIISIQGGDVESQDK